jgi:uncharacterized glyoxalase superfamily protein PhnB
MAHDMKALHGAVLTMRPFLPAKDFEVSKHFYQDLGFEVYMLGDKLAEMQLGEFSFLLQDYYVEQWAGNFMMHLLVKDVDLWWEHIASLDLATRYGVRDPSAPKMQPWGLRVAYVVDPSGVLWHFAQAPSSSK